ncbi:MAG: transcriptional regulator [Gammaproteobacteria bacterium]|nr:transcriptional regulator [Gammaproteobacteria bacterium]
MEAACDEFERNGYLGTKTAAIARKAGVAEALIFSNFGSKAKLFHDTIFKPLDRHFLEFCATHLVEPGDTAGLKKETRQYILELRQFIGRHSRMFSSLVAAQMYALDNVRGLSEIEGLQSFFARAAEMNRKRLTGKPRIDPKLLARVSFAAILACVIFKDWLFPAGSASEDEITAAISDFIMEGLNANADRKAGARRSTRERSSARAAGATRKQRATDT